MKLVTSLTSPYGRKVRVVLLEKKIPFQLQVENPWLPDSPVSSLNPLGKVPVLVLEGGESVFDSRVIVEYLDHVSPVAHLIPNEPKTRMIVRGVEALADGVTDAAVALFLEKKRASEQQSRDWLTLQEKTLFRGLEALSEALGEKPWYLGNSMTLADVACGCTLGYLGLRFSDIDWRTAHPNLAKLFDKLMARASFQDTVPVV
ncbi:MAG: glutathione S-transferase [Thiobacillus sp. GWE1_62_9]|nr:MAG: glutathione S-transferase [Thiobacillus sp. GWE1_62_9]HBU29600.1 glutathione S-transferase [Thiobacillus sp.]